jgi:hypothetical protein
MSTTSDKRNASLPEDGGTDSEPGNNTQPGKSHGDDENVRDESASKKPSKMKQLWNKVGLDAPTLILMFKGSLPPTIAIAMYQSPAVAAEYSTLGYLVAIASVLGMCEFENRSLRMDERVC